MSSGICPSPETETSATSASGPDLPGTNAHFPTASRMTFDRARALVLSKGRQLLFNPAQLLRTSATSANPYPHSMRYPSAFSPYPTSLSDMDTDYTDGVYPWIPQQSWWEQYDLLDRGIAESESTPVPTLDGDAVLLDYTGARTAGSTGFRRVPASFTPGSPGTGATHGRSPLPERPTAYFLTPAGAVWLTPTELRELWIWATSPSSTTTAARSDRAGTDAGVDGIGGTPLQRRERRLQVYVKRNLLIWERETDREHRRRYGQAVFWVSPLRDGGFGRVRDGGGAGGVLGGFRVPHRESTLV